MSKRVLITMGPDFDEDREEPEDLVTLMGDTEFGEGSIDWSVEFDEYNNLLKADLLKDWIEELQTRYTEICVEGLVQKPRVVN